MEEAQPRRKVGALVKVWLVVHVFLITSWSLPHGAPAIENGSVPATVSNVVQNLPDYVYAANDWFKVNSPTRFYLESTGLWQYWDMFAPNPSNVDIWVDAVVTYKDGTQTVGVYPRIKNLPFFWKYIKERYRKYLERSAFDEDSWTWPDFAQRMALVSYKDPNNPPVHVQLRRHFRIVPDMGTNPPEDYTEYTYFNYYVDLDRLRRDAGR